MAGIKGKSGRKSNRDERVRMLAIETAWDIFLKFLQDDEIDKTKKVEQLTKIIAKDMPTQITGEVLYTRMTSILIEKRNLELNFGNDVGSTADIGNTTEASAYDDGSE